MMAELEPAQVSVSIRMEKSNIVLIEYTWCGLRFPICMELKTHNTGHTCGGEGSTHEAWLQWKAGDGFLQHPQPPSLWGGRREGSQCAGR